MIAYLVYVLIAFWWRQNTVEYYNAKDLEHEAEFQQSVAQVEEQSSLLGNLGSLIPQAKHDFEEKAEGSTKGKKSS